MENSSTALGIESSSDLYEKLKYESGRLGEGWHSYDAFNYVITAWHLFQDWPKSDESRSLCVQKRKRNKLPASMNLVLDVIRDIANGSKHFSLNQQSIDRKKIDSIHQGQTSSWSEYFFHERIHGVSSGNYYFSIRVIRNISDAYFSWVFDDDAPVRVFPQEIVDAIEYCDLPNRSGKKAPSLCVGGVYSAEAVGKGKR